MNLYFVFFFIIFIGTNIRKKKKKSNKFTNCNIENWKEKTNNFTEINGKPLPNVEMRPLDNSIKIMDFINKEGKRVLVMKSIRRKKTRVGIHTHKYAGYTLVMSGTMTDFVQGFESKEYPTNTGYYMPACVPMAAANLGDEDANLIDVFILPPGEPFIEIHEPSWKYDRIGK